MEQAELNNVVQVWSVTVCMLLVVMILDCSGVRLARRIAIICRIGILGLQLSRVSLTVTVSHLASHSVSRLSLV